MKTPSVFLLLKAFCLVAVVTGDDYSSNDEGLHFTEERTDTVYSTVVLTKTYKREITYLRDFRDKVGKYNDRKKCIRDCRNEVCQKSAESANVKDKDQNLAYCEEKICGERICSKIADQQCYDAMSRRNSFSSINMKTCLNICGCDGVTSGARPAFNRVNESPASSPEMETWSFESSAADDSAQHSAEDTVISMSDNNKKASVKSGFDITQVSGSGSTYSASAKQPKAKGSKEGGQDMWAQMMDQFGEFSWCYDEPNNQTKTAGSEGGAPQAQAPSIKPSKSKAKQATQSDVYDSGYAEDAATDEKPTPKSKKGSINLGSPQGEEPSGLDLGLHDDQSTVTEQKHPQHKKDSGKESDVDKTFHKPTQVKQSTNPLDDNTGVGGEQLPQLVPALPPKEHKDKEVFEGAPTKPTKATTTTLGPLDEASSTPSTVLKTQNVGAKMVHAPYENNSTLILGEESDSKSSKSQKPSGKKSKQVDDLSVGVPPESENEPDKPPEPIAPTVEETKIKFNKTSRIQNVGGKMNNNFENNNSTDKNQDDLSVGVHVPVPDDSTDPPPRPAPVVKTKPDVPKKTDANGLQKPSKSEEASGKPAVVEEPYPISPKIALKSDSNDNSWLDQPYVPKRKHAGKYSGDVKEYRKKRDDTEVGLNDWPAPANSKSSPQAATGSSSIGAYSYCAVDAVDTKYEAIKCKKDCYGKCSPATTFGDQCLDSCYLLRCANGAAHCEKHCGEACSSEMALNRVREGIVQFSKAECASHVDKATFHYGQQHKNDLMFEFCINNPNLTGEQTLTAGKNKSPSSVKQSNQQQSDDSMYAGLL